MVLLEKVIEGLGVSKVLDSDDPNFKPGDIVSGLTRWEEYSLIYNHEHLRKVESDNMPLSYYTGLLGMNFLLHLFLILLLIVTLCFCLSCFLFRIRMDLWCNVVFYF